MPLIQAEGKSFRGWQRFLLAPRAKISVFTGPNGAGKSSLLEAAHAGLRGKSFRPSGSDHFIRHNESEASVRLSFQEGPHENQGRSVLEAFFWKAKAGGAPAACPAPAEPSGGILPPLPEPLKKTLLCSGKKISPLALARRFPALVFTEEKMQAIRQGPGERRAFADEMLAGNEGGKALSRLKKSLREKSSLLQSFKRGDISPSEARAALSALNGVFLQAAIPAVQARLKALEELFAGASQISPKFFPKRESLGFSYLIAGENIRENPGRAPLLMERGLGQKLDRELQFGRPLSGPQKHDIVFLMGGRDSRAFCSKGQQRLLIFSLLGWQAICRPGALLLLDDALGELDAESQKRLLFFLEEAPAQSFLTSCGAPPKKTKNMSIFSVNNGKIVSL